jgi:DNA recombination protein RmuC
MTTLLAFIIGALAGVAVALAVTRTRVTSAGAIAEALRRESDEVRGERDAASADTARLRDELGSARESAVRDVAEAHGAGAEVATTVRAELADARAELATARTELLKEREAQADRLHERDAALARLDERVKAALSEALPGSTRQLVALAKSEFGREREVTKREIAAEHQRLNKMFESVNSALGKVEGKLGDIEKERAVAREQLDAQLEALRGSHKELLAGTQALVGALHRPEVRGRWGEFQLRNLVEQAGMLPHVDFDEQPTVVGGDGVLRPDACLHMPGGRDVVVDSKVPLEALLQASAATDPDERDALLREHARQLRAHLNKLDSKAYWDAMTSVPDFVAMFVPSDEVVLAAMRVDRKLAEDVHAKRVVIVSPMNMMALLRVIALGWRQEKLAENAEEVARVGRDLHKRLGVFARRLSQVGKRLGSLLKAWNDAVGSFDHNVVPAARRFTELGVVSHDHEIAGTDALPFAPREIEGRGLPELPEGNGDGGVVELGGKPPAQSTGADDESEDGDPRASAA